MKDSRGVDIQPSDIVMVTAWGSGARLADVRTKSRVLGFGRTRVRVIDANGLPRGIDPACLTVMRRDGASGFEANREVVG